MRIQGMGTPLTRPPLPLPPRPPADGYAAASGASTPVPTPLPTAPAPHWNVSILRPCDGGFERFEKRPCYDAELVRRHGDRTYYVEKIGDQPRAVCVNHSGEEQFGVPIESAAFPTSMELDPSGQRLYVKSGKTLLAIDTANGSVVNQRRFGDASPLRHLAVLPCGTVVCTDFQSLRSFDRDLHDGWSQKQDLTAGQVRVLANGTLMMLDDKFDGHLRVVDKAGKSCLESQRVMPGSTQMDAAGHLWLVERRRGLGSDVEAQVVRYDVGSGQTSRLSAPPGTHSVIPRSDASYLCVQGSRMELRGADHACSLDLGGKLRQVCLSQDENSLYALVGREGTQVLCHCDLKSGQVKSLYSEAGEERILPIIQPDGSALIVSRQAITCVDAGGQPARAPQTVVEGARRIQLFPHTDPDGRNGLDSMIALSHYRFGWPALPPPHPALNTNDDSFEFARGPVGWETAGFAAEDQYLAARLSADLLPRWFHRSHRLPYDGGYAEVTRDQVKLGKVNYGLSGDIVAARVFQTEGGRPYLLAGTDDGLLYWCDTRGQGRPSFDLGTPPQAMQVLDGRTIRVLGQDGTVMLLQPPLGAGENLRMSPEQPPPALQIIVKDDQVSLGGVTVPRHRQPPRGLPVFSLKAQCTNSAV